mmetsp:Transcript_25228/g.59835  ORF Transcript_25228/g.59835 Transcript_25228/m.59835 type:complete len:392 (-) Transcript_25228:972-2147(-)
MLPTAEMTCCGRFTASCWARASSCCLPARLSMCMMLSWRRSMGPGIAWFHAMSSCPDGARVANPTPEASDSDGNEFARITLSCMCCSVWYGCCCCGGCCGCCCALKPCPIIPIMGTCGWAKVALGLGAAGEGAATRAICAVAWKLERRSCCTRPSAAPQPGPRSMTTTTLQPCPSGVASRMQPEGFICAVSAAPLSGGESCDVEVNDRISRPCTVLDAITCRIWHTSSTAFGLLGAKSVVLYTPVPGPTTSTVDDACTVHGDQSGMCWCQSPSCSRCSTVANGTASSPTMRPHSELFSCTDSTPDPTDVLPIGSHAFGLEKARHSSVSPVTCAILRYWETRWLFAGFAGDCCCCCCCCGCCLTPARPMKASSPIWGPPMGIILERFIWLVW